MSTIIILLYSLLQSNFFSYFLISFCKGRYGKCLVLLFLDINLLSPQRKLIKALFNLLFCILRYKFSLKSLSDFTPHLAQSVESPNILNFWFIFAHRIYLRVLNFKDLNTSNGNINFINRFLSTIIILLYFDCFFICFWYYKSLISTKTTFKNVS